MRRARETAEPIGAARGPGRAVDDRLRERLNWESGVPSGRFQADRDRSTGDRDFVLGNGESSRSAGERLLSFVAGLRGSGPAAAVTHLGVTIDLLRTLAGDAALPPRLLDHGIAACAITTLEDLEVIAIESTGHFLGTIS